MYDKQDSVDALIIRSMSLPMKFVARINPLALAPITLRILRDNEDPSYGFKVVVELFARRNLGSGLIHPN